MSSPATVLTRGVPLFDGWANRAGIPKYFDLRFLNGCTIGIDAVYFLEGLTLKEPHLSAVGGSHALDSHITKFVKNLQAAGISLHFVFDGLDSGSGNDRMVNSERAATMTRQAFELYTSKEADPAYASFQSAGPSDFSTLSGILKKTLHELGVTFTVAPYSALAQLVYYERHPSQYIDAVLGPSELFCFGIDKIITNLALEKSEFGWIKLQDCLTGLGNISSHVFIDALMLAGSSLLSQFPSISNLALYPKGGSMRNVTELISSGGGSVPQLCAQFSSESSIKEVYLAQYKRATTSVRYQMVITDEGDVEPLHKQQVPDDVHECIGLRLPEELYMYLSRGMLGPRVLNWLKSGTIIITQPLAGGDSDIYRELVKTKLDPLRRQALSLLAEPMHRYYHTKEVKTKLWFDSEYEGKFNMKELPSMKDSLSKWNVKNDLFAGLPEYMPPGTFQFAVTILENTDLAAKTVTPKAQSGHQPLKTRKEILANVVWRFLQLRGYVDEQHQLTAWGKVLQEAMFAGAINMQEEEAVFLAIEMMRFELVNPDTMFLGYSGAPEHGTTIDKRNCMLVSRVACLGKINHEQRAYSGPLSRHLLAYQSVISSVHAALRDLMEMTLVGMFLEGLVDRDRNDWVDISLGLPFCQEQSCALGVLTMTYLDDLATYPDTTSEKVRSEVMEKGQEWFQSTDFRCSLEDAFKIWDAVYQGIAAAGSEMKDKEKVQEMWDEVNTWLLQRR